MYIFYRGPYIWTLGTQLVTLLSKAVESFGHVTQFIEVHVWGVLRRWYLHLVLAWAHCFLIHHDVPPWAPPCSLPHQWWTETMNKNKPFHPSCFCPRPINKTKKGNRYIPRYTVKGLFGGRERRLATIRMPTGEGDEHGQNRWYTWKKTQQAITV